jgi:hypothetical protein
MNLASERSSLSSASEIYACCDRVKIKRHWADYPELGECCRALKKLEKALGDEAKDEYWESFLRHLRRYQFLLLTLPLPSDHPAIYRSGVFEALEERLVQCDRVYPDFANGARHLLQSYAGLAAQRANPSLQEIVKLCAMSEQSKIALILKETRFIEDVETMLSLEKSLHHIKVVGTQYLRGETCYQDLILLGATRWYPEHIFSAPRAPEIYIVSYNWIKDEWKPEPAFAGSHLVTASAIPFSRAAVYERTSEEPGLTGNYPTVEELLPEINLDQLSLEFFSRHSTSDFEHEEIEACLFLLESGTAVFVDASENAKMLVIDLNEDVNDEEAGQRISPVKRISVSLIEPGMFILLRTNGGGDYVVPLADKILGNQAQQIRARQEHWKGLLRVKVREKGLLATSIDLLDRGSVRAEESNVRNWISSRNIRPHDKNDFAAIMKFVGLEDKIDEYWKNTKAILSAHMKAGFHIRKLLLKKVASADLEELQRTGKMDFELRESGAGSLTAFRIQALSQKHYLVPVSHIGRPFESYEDLWQE